MLKVGYYQFRPRFGEVGTNLRKVVDALADADADLIVLPELAFTGYHFKDRAETLALAEDPLDAGPSGRLPRSFRDHRLRGAGDPCRSS